MRTSQKGLLAIIEFEGCVLVPYKDAVGIWTIGVGHTAAAGPPNPKGHVPITLGQALDIFINDLEKFEEEVERAVKIDLAQHEFDSIVSWHFNTGAVAHASLIKRLNDGARQRAADGLLDWSLATIGGRKLRLPGLLARRNAERAMFLRGDYGEPFMARIYEKWPSKGVIRNLSGLIV